jgi:hypothetical protein
VKSLIADEVKREFAAEQAAAQRTPPVGTESVLPALDTNDDVFVVSSNLLVATDLRACVLTPGDVIRREGTVVTDDGKVGVVVLSSKPGDCPVDSTTSIQVAALQDMHNQFVEQIDAGLAELARAHGHNGLPAVDPVALATSRGPTGNVQPDSNAANELRKGLAEADKAEVQILRASNAGN